MENLAVGESVGQFKRKPRAEILRHTAGNVLYADSARRHEQIYAIGVALFNNARYLLFITVVGLLVKVAVVVDNDKNRGFRPSVVIHSVGEAGAGKTRLAFIQNARHHRKELGDGVGLQTFLVEIAAHMRRSGEDGKHFRAEVQTVDVQEVRRIR